MIHSLKLSNLLFFLLVFSSLSPVAALAQEDNTKLQAQGRQAAQAFASALKAELMAGLQAGGPAEAIKVCQQKAPRIAESVSAETGWKIGRTSQRLRNPANAPDAWESKVLARFAAQAAGGLKPGQLIFGETIQENGRREYRLMIGIATDGLCLKCHGPSLSQPVKARLAELYPRDQAIGFKAGQLRGAFTLRKPLP